MSIILPVHYQHFVSVKTYKEKNWLLIFHHNTTQAGFFSSTDYALFSIIPGRFSILLDMNDSWKIDGKFELMLEYLEHNKRNIWKQSVNPISDREADRLGQHTAQGYEAISIDEDDSGWGGLVRSSNSKSTLLDGSVNYNDYWFYSVGTVVKLYTDESIPYASDKLRANDVRLWIRFDTLQFKGRWPTVPKYHKALISFFLVNILN